MSPYVYPGIRLNNNIMANACKLFGVTQTQILSNSRKREIVEARQLLMYYYNRIEGLSLSNTGIKFNKDHATVLHACKKVDDLIQVDKEFKNKYEILINGYEEEN